MPRPMLRMSPKSQVKTEKQLNTSFKQNESVQTRQMDKMKLDRLLRKTRSKEYMQAMHQLDAGGHVQNQQKVDEIINRIKSEFPEVEITGILLGVISVCYLGRPYEVHTIDVTGGIVKHYKVREGLPNGLEKARGLALNGGYCFIEVYVDCFRAVDSNGEVSVIPY